MEDNEIIDLFFARSERAIIELANKYDAICKSLSYNILNNMQDVEECINDTHLGVWNTIPPSRPDPLVTYVCKITRNLSLKRFRYNTAKKRNSFYDVSLSELEECIPDNKIEKAEITEEELAHVIEQFLDSLDRDNRVLFMKRYWFSEAISEIASEFRMSENNVSVKLLRIRKKFKKYLAKKGVAL